MSMGKTWGVLAVSVGVALLPETVRAEEMEEAVAPSPPRTIVLLHPVNRLGVGVERAVGSHVALAAALTAQFYLYGSRLQESSLVSSGTWGVGLDPGVHVYLAGRAPEGFWVGAHLEAELSRSNSRGTSFGEGGTQEYSSSSTLSSLGGSARVGYTAILAPGLTLQAGACVRRARARWGA